MTDPVKITRFNSLDIIPRNAKNTSFLSYASVVVGELPSPASHVYLSPMKQSSVVSDSLSSSSLCSFVWINRHDDLTRVCKIFSKATCIAVDTEFKGKQLCLIQINCEESIYLIDPLTIYNLEPLFKIFRNPNIAKIFHACREDIKHLCIGIQNVIDTQLLAQYYPGLEYSIKQPIGYKRLLHNLLGIDLEKDKQVTCSDWSGRPLSTEQMAYAASDVKDLVELYIVLAGRLEKIKIKEAYDKCARICQRVDGMRQQPTSYIMGNVAQASGQKSKVNGGYSAMRKKLSASPGKSEQDLSNPPQKHTHSLDELSYL